MKDQQRLMRIVQIENNYQKHRQRLLSIQHIDSRKKPNVSTIRPAQACTAYKESRLKADLFTYKSRNDRIHRENQILLTHIEQQLGKSNDNKLRQSLSRSPSSQSIRSNHSKGDIKMENSRLLEKISNTKSVYSKIRQQKQRAKSKQVSKEEIINLLVNQLGVKPTVLFPALPNRVRPSKSLRNRTLEDKNIKFHFNNLESIRAKHNFASHAYPKK